MSVLERILAVKRTEVAALRRAPGEAELSARAARADAPRGFARALRTGGAPRVIAEFKRASPSRGEIRPGADPAEIARAYQAAGAVALSVLTDREFFRGELDDLRRARAACRLPVLRKDFTIDPLQLVEARGAGADAALLIVGALEDGQLRELLACARELALDALVEVHDEPEPDVGVTRALLPRAAGRTVVSESGLEAPETLRALAAEGASAFLIGEALMRAPDPGAALRRLRGVA